VKVAFTPYAQKLDDIMRIIRKHAGALELEVSLASEISKLLKTNGGWGGWLRLGI
jgi:hypothetical protein